MTTISPFALTIALSWAVTRVVVHMLGARVVS
jgi:hypothetical protein